MANGAEIRWSRSAPITGAPTYYQQIWTSIQTVFFGFILATIIAVPLGIMPRACRQSANAALNPLIQIFKPVSAAGMAAHRHHRRLSRLHL